MSSHLVYAFFLHVNRDQFGMGTFGEQISMTYTLTQNITHSHSEHVSGVVRIDVPSDLRVLPYVQ